MSRQFDVKALMRIAVLDERAGSRMYSTMAGIASPELKPALEDLAKQETGHETRFQKLLEDLERTSGDEPLQYPDEYVDYLEVLVSKGGSTTENTDFEGLDDLGLIEKALSFEQEHLNLQRDMANLLSDEYQSAVNPILREEMAHIVTLAELKEKVS